MEQRLKRLLNTRIIDIQPSEYIFKITTDTGEVLVLTSHCYDENNTELDGSLDWWTELSKQRIGFGSWMNKPERRNNTWKVSS